MVYICQKYHKEIEEAKSKCSEQCSPQCRSYKWISESAYNNWLRIVNRSPSPPSYSISLPKSSLLKRTPEKKWILIDANILVNAKREGKIAKNCQAILYEEGLATTDLVLKEAFYFIGDIDDINLKIITISEAKISKELKELKSSGLKQPSIQDKSLIQAAVNDHTIIGIITYDPDFFNIATKGYVEKKTERSFWVKTPEEYLKDMVKRRRKY